VLVPPEVVYFFDGLSPLSLMVMKAPLPDSSLRILPPIFDSFPPQMAIFLFLPPGELLCRSLFMAPFFSPKKTRLRGNALKHSPYFFPKGPFTGFF